jgi:hypothetical protein
LMFLVLLFMILDKYYYIIRTNILIIVKMYKFFNYTLICKDCMNID